MTVVHRREAHCCSDDWGGFEAFYTATAERTYLTVRRMTAGDPHLAHDATQDAYVVLLECWSQRQHLPLDVNRRYIVGIAAHKVIDRYRSQRRDANLDDECDQPLEDNGFTELINELSALRAVRELIDRQPARRRAVATLYFLEEATYPEIATALRITESTVRTHVERMRALLKPLIDQITEPDEGGGGHD
jgi:RNA polymerase sigma-70 factor (ECF subfamily)